LLTEAIEHPNREQTIIHLYTGTIFRCTAQRGGVLVFKASSPVFVDGIFNTKCTNKRSAMVFVSIIVK